MSAEWVRDRWKEKNDEWIGQKREREKKNSFDFGNTDIYVYKHFSGRGGDISFNRIWRSI